MSFYLLLFLAFLVQEPVSSNALLYTAYAQHYNLWLVSVLFLVSTIVDIIAGHYLGLWVKTRFPTSRAIRLIDRATRPAADFLHRHGQEIFLFFWAPYIFPISAVIAPWLEIPLWKTLIYITLGDFITWYALEWLIVLGASSFIPDPLYALTGVVVLSVALSYVLKHFRNRQTN